MKKRVLTIAAMLAVCFFLRGAAGAVTLTNVDSSLRDAVTAADQAGLLPGSMDQQRGVQTITREQLCETAVRVYASVKGADYETLAEQAGKRLDACPYTDISGDDIRLAWLLGLTAEKGKDGKTRFYPKKTVSVQKMVTMLYRAIATAGGDVVLSQNQIAEVLESSEDGDKVDDWARQATACFLYQGVISQDDDGRIGARDNATCELLAATAFRAAAVGYTAAKESGGDVAALSTHSGSDKVTWTNCNADSYRVYYYKKKNFSVKPTYIDLISASDSGTMEAMLPDTVQDAPGNWYWSVDAFDCDGRLMGSTQSTIKLTVKEETTPSRSSAAADTDTAQSIAAKGLAYAGESYQGRCNRIFGGGSYHRYASEAEAVRHQTTIRIPIWKMDSSGKKYSATVNLTVNTGVAKTVQQIFQEIYESDERFPIKDIGGYNWRGDGSPSEHCLGLAIDINYNENYMCTNSGAALTGSFWRPGENPYSISPNSDVVRIFAKYGFGWGGTWNSKKDYMHFSYFHT